MLTSDVIVMMMATLLVACHAHPYQTAALPSKRAALVLDRLLVALRNALDDHEPLRRRNTAAQAPHSLLLRHPLPLYTNELSYGSPLRRKDKTLVDKTQDVRSRVKQCFFNAVTCF